MKSLIKLATIKLLPSLYYRISSYRFSRYCRTRFEEFQIRFSEDVYGNNQIHVLTGPFRGMKYYQKIVWGPITPKWIGSYEAELHEFITDIIDSQYSVIIDVGAAEGYYAVGLAWKCGSSRVFAFDIDPIARVRQRELAELNEIHNLEIRKYCHHSDFSDLVRGRTLVICDIEGFEALLLDPKEAPELIEADILVEIHSHHGLDAKSVENLMRDRFQKTHTIKTRRMVDREPKEYQSMEPMLQKIGSDRLKEALNEHRHGSQAWLWMKAEP